MKLEFEWHNAKAEANLRAHGVSFELAKTVFKDPFAIERLDDRADYGEVRFVVIGMADGNILLFVAYTERLLTDRTLAATMGKAGRECALATSWEQIFEDMHRSYERYFHAPEELTQGVFEARDPEFGALKRLG